MDDLQQAVAKLRALSPKLNSAADQAHRVVVQIEHFLANECQVAVQAEVPVIYNDKGVAVTLMRYGRVDGKFRIALTNTDGDARFITRGWTDCDRSEKLASFPALPRLVMAVTKAVETQIASTTATANTVNQIISALGSDGNIDGEPLDSQPKLTLLVKPEDALADMGLRPAPRPRDVPKMNPDSETRRPHRKEEAKVG
jgi:hypothetical protein